MSAHLKWGEIHPRTLLAQLDKTKAHDVYRKEIAWREFYADVLFHNPHTEKGYYSAIFEKMQYDKPGKNYQAWCEGRTGFPFVDAAMRQLLREGYMHNRARMVVASFLTKDLGIDWRVGARHFLEWLTDGDLARGFYVEPTVVSVPAGHRLYRDELFAPLTAVCPVDSLDEALRLANMRYEAGYSGFLEVLDAQRTLNLTQLAWIRNRQSLLSANVDLMKALGGGWYTDNTTPTASR